MQGSGTLSSLSATFTKGTSRRLPVSTAKRSSLPTSRTPSSNSHRSSFFSKRPCQWRSFQKPRRKSPLQASSYPSIAIQSKSSTAGRGAWIRCRPIAQIGKCSVALPPLLRRLTTHTPFPAFQSFLPKSKSRLAPFQKAKAPKAPKEAAMTPPPSWAAAHWGNGKQPATTSRLTRGQLPAPWRRLTSGSARISLSLGSFGTSPPWQVTWELAWTKSSGLTCFQSARTETVQRAAARGAPKATPRPHPLHTSSPGMNRAWTSRRSCRTLRWTRRPNKCRGYKDTEAQPQPTNQLRAREPRRKGEAQEAETPEAAEVKAAVRLYCLTGTKVLRLAAMTAIRVLNSRPGPRAPRAAFRPAQTSRAPVAPAHRF